MTKKQPELLPVKKVTLPTSVVALSLDAEEVAGILSGTRSQVRRPVRPQPPPEYGVAIYDAHGLCSWMTEASEEADAWPYGNPMRCPYGAPGGRVWVREPWWLMPVSVKGDQLVYRADASDPELEWFKELHGHWEEADDMPRWASRLRLPVVAVKVQTIQTLEASDLAGEGWKDPLLFLAYWASRYPKGRFRHARNPWVWALQFGAPERTG